jgi:hypothetical protein
MLELHRVFLFELRAAENPPVGFHSATIAEVVPLGKPGNGDKYR